MANERGKREWDHTALIWSILANANRDPKKQPKPFCPSMVHPYRSADDYKSKPKQIPIEELARLFGARSQGG